MQLLEQYRELHRLGSFPGFSLRPYVKEIAKTVKRTGARTLLDYGCGEGRQYTEERMHERWGVMPALYDPARADLAVKPSGVFDGVICTDVLEHVPEDEVPKVCGELGSYARKFLFVSICSRPAKRHLPNGINCHVTLYPKQVWEEILAKCIPSGCELIVKETP